jgi:hypothetical protein
VETSFPSKLPEYAQFGKPIVIWGPEYCSAIHWGREGDRALCITEASPKVVVAALQNLSVDPQERLKYFGQEDHVRVYGLDYIDRLCNAGFKVSVTSVRDLCPDKTANLMGLNIASGNIYYCTK